MTPDGEDLLFLSFLFFCIDSCTITHCVGKDVHVTEHQDDAALP